MWACFLKNSRYHTHTTIDYRCEHSVKIGRFPLSASDVTILNLDSLPSCETRVNPGIRSWKVLNWMSLMSESHCWYLFHKEVKSWALTTGLEFDNFKPWLESGNFKCNSWLNGSFLGGDDWCFLKEGFKSYLMAPISPPNSLTVFCLHIYSLCTQQTY
jgi:hypothetical protein